MSAGMVSVIFGGVERLAVIGGAWSLFWYQRVLFAASPKPPPPPPSPKGDGKEPEHLPGRAGRQDEEAGTSDYALLGELGAALDEKGGSDD